MTGRGILRCVIAICLAMLAASRPVTAATAVAAVSTPDQQILVMVQHPPDHYRPNGAYGGGYGDGVARCAGPAARGRTASPWSTPGRCR